MNGMCACNSSGVQISICNPVCAALSRTFSNSIMRASLCASRTAPVTW